MKALLSTLLISTLALAACGSKKPPATPGAGSGSAIAPTGATGGTGYGGTRYGGKR